MAGSRQLACLAEELSCSICLSLFVEPVSLPCEHSFCRPCISQCWEAQGELGPQEGPSCPHCRLPCPGKALKPNRVLTNLVEQLRCLELELGDSPLCLEHEEALKLFCEDDQELICLICRDDPKHSQHSFLPLRQAASKYKHQLNEIMSTEEGKQQKRSILIEQISALQVSVGVRPAGGMILLFYEGNLRDAFAPHLLAGREQHLSEELEQETEQCRRSMEENLTAAERVRSTAEQGLSQLRAAIAEKNDSAFLKALKGLKQRFQEKGGNEVMNVVKRGPELGIFKGPLQYTVWKEMLQILSPVLASLTLDSRTAQPRLILSEDLTKVHSGNLRRNLPNGRERFEPCTCVISSQGFTSGKHYWEVEVANKTDWDLGLALETAGRKGQITLMPSVGYWTICRRHGHTYAALAVPSVILKLTAKPRKIGIYLDYEGGQVSFYNAGSMSHLYTFTDTFKGKLFPFFNPWINKNMGNSEPLRLLHLKLMS